MKEIQNREDMFQYPNKLFENTKNKVHNYNDYITIYYINIWIRLLAIWNKIESWILLHIY